MKEHFVTKEIAISMEEIGFDEPCICGYNSYGALKHNIAISSPNKDDFVSSDKYDKKINAPTWEQVIDWFIKQYNYSIVIDNVIHGWFWEIVDVKSGGIIIQYECELTDGRFIYIKNRHEAREFGILKAIELIKSNQTK